MSELMMYTPYPGAAPRLVQAAAGMGSELMMYTPYPGAAPRLVQASAGLGSAWRNAPAPKRKRPVFYGMTLAAPRTPGCDGVMEPDGRCAAAGVGAIWAAAGMGAYPLVPAGWKAPTRFDSDPTSKSVFSACPAGQRKSPYTDLCYYPAGLGSPDGLGTMTGDDIKPFITPAAIGGAIFGASIGVKLGGKVGMPFLGQLAGALTLAYVAQKGAEKITGGKYPFLTTSLYPA